jgi:hypothetical protein
MGKKEIHLVLWDKLVSYPVISGPDIRSSYPQPCGTAIYEVLKWQNK